MLIGLASANLTVGGNSGNLKVFQDDSVSGYFIVTSTENTTIVLSDNLPSDLNMDYETGTNVELVENTPKRIDFTITADNNADDGEKTINITMTSSDPLVPPTSYTFKLDVKKALFFSDIDVDDDFDVGDTIKIDVEIKAKDDIDFTITAEIDGENIDTDLDESLDDGDRETYTLELELPYNLDEGEYNLIVTIEADNNDEQTKEETFSIDVNKERNRLVFDKIELLTSNPSCGGPLDVKVKVANAGTRDQDDTKVSLYNSALGINLDKTLDINDGDTKTFQFSTILPTVAPGSYTLQITADSDDASVSGTLRIDLQVNCKAQVKDVQIFIMPQNTGNIDQDTIFKATITNNGDVETTYNIAAQNYQTWATLTSLTPTQLTINPGQSQDVAIILKPLSSAASLNTFQVKVTFGTETRTQDATLSIQSKSQSITGSTIGTGFFQNLGKNVWLLIINIVLIVIVIGLIILVSIKPSKEKEDEEPKEARLKKVKRK